MTDVPPFPFDDRREYALARMPDGAMVVPAAPLRFKSGDSEYRYRPDSELFYLTGWTDPHCVAVLRGFAESDRFVLFVPDRDPDAELWTGPRRDADEIRERYGVDLVLPLGELEQHLEDKLLGGDRIYYRWGGDDRCDLAVRGALGQGRRIRPRSGVGPHVLADPGAILDGMRATKDGAEVARMRRAADITVSAFGCAIGAVAPEVGEWQVEAALESEFRRRGADGPAFATIVGAGVNGCTLHYVANGSTIANDDLVLIDAGAEVDFYASDVTRTVPASGRFEGAARDVYQVVLGAQQEGLAACQPGATLDDVHDVTLRGLVGGLIELGAVEGPLERAIDETSYRSFYPHRTSHWLGLDTHDVGPYATREGPVELQAGMTFTVEPGLYFRAGSCEGAAHLEGIGVRIEDDVLITEGGSEVLTGALPTSVEAVEDMVRG